MEDSKSIENRLIELEKKVDATYRSSEKLRKYFLWTLIITVVTVVLPLLVIPFLLPAFFASMQLPAGF